MPTPTGRLARRAGHRDPPPGVGEPRGHLRPGRRPRDGRAQGGGDLRHRAHRGPRLRGGGHRPDGRRGRRAVAPWLVGRHRLLGPTCPGGGRRGARAGRRYRVHLTMVRHGPRRRGRARDRAGHHLDGLEGRPRRPRDRARCAQRAGLLRFQIGALGAAHRRDPEPLGQGPRRAHPLPARTASRRLRRGGGLPRAGRLPQPAPHRAGPGVPRLHHRALGHRQSRHRRHRV